MGAPELWYHAQGGDAEDWGGGCATREEAIEEGKTEYDSPFYITRATNPPLRLADWIEAEDILQRAENQLADSDRVSSDGDDGPWFEATPDQLRDLDERLRQACDEWQAAHRLTFTCRTLEDMTAPERIDFDQDAAWLGMV